jgi:hypothetical protein
LGVNRSSEAKTSHWEITICDALDIWMVAAGRNGRSNPNTYCTVTLTAHPGEFEPPPPLQEDDAFVPAGAPVQSVVISKHPAVATQALLST